MCEDSKYNWMTYPLGKLSRGKFGNYSLQRSKLLPALSRVIILLLTEVTGIYLLERLKRTSSRETLEEIYQNYCKEKVEWSHIATDQIPALLF